MESMFEAFVFDKRLNFKVKEVKQGMFFDGKDFQLESYPLEHGIETLGYRLVEKDRRKVDMKKARKLGIPEGPLIGKLQQGTSIEYNNKKIKPDDVTEIEKGKIIAYVTDTVLCDGCYKTADNADLLICEATYASKLVDKSEEYGHLTAKHAGQLANKANVKQLVLIHFSARYKNTQEIEEDARDVFDNVICAKDFMRIEL